MNWIEQVTILDLLLKGLIIGIVVSAPLGPVGVLCIQRTLNKGRWYGFVTGVGAALSDICYALITGYGMSFMDELILKHHIFLQVVGSIMLLAFGIYTFRSNPVKSLRPASGTRGTYLHNFVTAFFVTLSNPLIIFLFIGLFARFSFVMPGSPIGFQLEAIWPLSRGHWAGGSALRISSTRYVRDLICAASGCSTASSVSWS